MQACHSVTAYPPAFFRRSIYYVRLVHLPPRIHSLVRQHAGARSFRTITPRKILHDDQKPEFETGKKRRPSPAPVLIDVLRSAGHDFALPNDLKAHHVDLSYIKPGNDFGARLKRAVNEENNLSPPKTRTAVKEPGLTLQSILAQYVRKADEKMYGQLGIEEDDFEPGSRWEALTRGEDESSSMRSSQQDVGAWATERTIPRPTAESEDVFLQRRGYNREDVKQWVDILCEKRSENAARRMLVHQQQNDSLGRKALPIFLVLFFLRRPHLNPEALRFCLILGWQEVTRRRTFLRSFGEYTKKYPAYGQVPVWDDHSLFLLIIRLLRHARIVWSEAVVTIAAMFSQYLKDTLLSPTEALPAYEKIRLTTLYNRVMSLISLPLSQNPFHSITSQERAQFDLLRDMTLYNPPLQINREGYRAIIAVQLAQKKTSQERDWDNLKARSWPPWKQDKTGLDADKDRAYGTSRAMHVINRSQDAGYGPRRWESTASILAGWDVDGSPTIQKRALLLHKAVSSTSAVEDLEDFNIMRFRKASNPHLYAARISSARTLQEAWAFFLQYKNDNSHADLNVYLATLSKIAAEDKRLSLLQSSRRKFNPRLQVENRSINAGDSLEVVAPPDDPKEATYLKSPPPSFDELVMEMFEQGLQVQGHHLASLLRMTNSLENGVSYLLRAADYESRSLLVETPEKDRRRLGNVDKSVFSAWVALLCRFPVATLKLDRVQGEEHLSTRFLHVDRPVEYAVRLVRARKAITRPPWHTILETLGKPYVTTRLRRFYKKNNPERFEHATVIQGVLHSMSEAGVPPDQRTLQIICRALEPAIIDAQNIIGEVAMDRPNLRRLPEIETSATADDIPMTVTKAAQLLGEGPQYIQSIFNAVMGVGSKKADSKVTKAVERYKLPRLLATPTADALHAYMRVLGVLQDWQGVFNLVEWMVKYRREVEAAVQMPKNGPKLLRRTLVAARVYLERSWVFEKSERVDLQAAPDKTIANVRKMIVETKEWGGWPTDAEVADYCAVGRFPQQAPEMRRMFRYELGQLGSAERF